MRARAVRLSLTRLTFSGRSGNCGYPFGPQTRGLAPTFTWEGSRGSRRRACEGCRTVPATLSAYPGLSRGQSNQGGPMMAKSHMHLAVVVLLAVSGAWAATVTISPQTEYQTIEGFGAHGAENVWWSGGPFATQSFVNTIVDDLGLTMNRNEFYPDFEPSNENGDASNLNYSAFNFSGTFMNKQRAWIQALKAKADASGEPMRFIATYWSPPAWMKTNNSTTDGGSLKAGIENEFAEYAKATIRAYKEECGVDLYALSLQNELAFSQYFNSCVYTPESYRDMVKIVGPQLHAAYPNVKLFGPEDMLGAWTVRAYPGRLMADPVSREQMWAIAVHGYSDGVNPTPSADAPQLWSRAANNMAASGKPLWMTETSGYSNDWNGARGTAEAIFEALKYGKVAAWVWWQLSGTHTAGEILMPGGNRGKLFYAAKQYFRYIRPGAVMIQVDSDDDEVFTIGFHHKQQQTLTLVILNWASSQRQIQLSGGDLPDFTLYRTSSSDNCSNKGTVGSSFSLPGNSINTLYGTGYSPTRITPRAGSTPAAFTGNCTARIYSLDGRLLRTIKDVKLSHDGALTWDTRRAAGAGVATGSYYTVVTDPHGRRVAARSVAQSR
ncbi:MAG: hypothetical protein GF331_24730 [Chitinivibrionales bacterium]|nr:hypothetical protein [Chitinivibrionales bacterium]